MKIFIGLLVVLILGFASLFVVSANASRNCYIVAQKELDASAFQSTAYPDSRGVQCISSQQTIIALGSCLERVRAKIPSSARTQLVPLVDQIVSWIRYGSSDVTSLRNAHDQDCSAYVDTMFVPPDLIGK